MSAARGSSVRLSCEAVYDPVRCEDVHVAWFQDTSELTRPHKYMTVVSESLISEPGRRRRRQVVTEILDLQPEDADRFQCRALCREEVSAVGHAITIQVTGDDSPSAVAALERREGIQTGNVGRCQNSNLVFLSSSSLVGRPLGG